MIAAVIKVLYVDDEESLLDIVRTFLEESGALSVATSESAPAALELLKNEQFDAIVSDYQMPEMDGIQFLAEVRARFGLIPFILFTGKGREEVVIQAINSGVDFYLQKGGEPEAQFAELEHKIKQAVSRKLTEDSLRRSEEKYRQLIQNSDEAIVVVQDGILRMINQRAVELSGYPKEELLSMSFLGFIHPDDRALVAERYKKRLRGEGFPMRYPFRLNPKDGSTKWVELGAIMIDWDGRPATLNFLTDITERKQAEEQLRIKNNVFESSITANSIADNQGILTSVNPAFLSLWGYGTKEDVIGKSLNSFFADEQDTVRVLEVLGTFGRWDGEFIARRADNSTFIAHGIATVIRDDAGKQIGYQSTVLDITLSKQAEETLRQTRDYLENLFTYANAPIIVWNPAFEITRFNHAFEELTGRNEQQVLGKRLELLFPPESCDTSMDLIQKALSGEKWKVVEIPIVNAISGEVKIVLWNSANILTPDGSKVMATIAQGQDITERKIAEKSLLEEKNFSDRLFDAPQDTVFLFEPATGKPVRWNKRFADESGYTDEEIADMKAPDDFYSDEDLNKAKEAMARLSGGNVTIELSLVTKQGTQIPFEYSATVIGTADGRTLLLSIGRNITERRQAEELLMQNQLKLATAMDLAKIVNWEYDVRTGEFIFDDRFYAFYGTTAEREGGNRMPAETYAREFVLPADIPLVGDEIQKLLKTTDPLYRGQMEHRIIRRDGDIRTIIAQYAPVMGADGHAIRTFGANQNITERKRAEEELMFKNALLSTQQETLPGAILIVNENGKILNYNRIFIEMLGIPDDVIASRSDERALQSMIEKVADKEAFLARISYLNNHIYDKSYDEILLKDGRILERYSAPMFGEKQRYFGRFWYFRDITDRKKAEEDLLKSLHEKDLLVKEIHHRVKNNLQTIASLLYLQSLSCEDEQIKILLNEVRSRVNAMGLIHQKLYQSTDISHVPFTDYINILIESLKESYGVDATKIRFLVQVTPDNLALDIDTGIPCGLIINELVTNTLKYAFRNRPGGTITIQMNRDEQHQYVLSVSDDGGGIPADLDISQLKSLGMTIVSSLVRQLSGTMEIVREPGTTITIRFPAQEPHTSEPSKSAEKPGTDKELSIDEKIKRIRARHD